MNQLLLVRHGLVEGRSRLWSHGLGPPSQALFISVLRFEGKKECFHPYPAIGHDPRVRGTCRHMGVSQ
jgi:hypothetical protein